MTDIDLAFHGIVGHSKGGGLVFVRRPVELLLKAPRRVGAHHITPLSPVVPERHLARQRLEGVVRERRFFTKEWYVEGLTAFVLERLARKRPGHKPLDTE